MQSNDGLPQQPPPGVLPDAAITVYALGEPYVIRREGAQFYVQGIAARILSVEENTVRLAYETEELDQRLQLRNMPLTGEQFYELLYGDQTPDLGRFGRLEAQLEMLTQPQAPTIVPGLTEPALAKMLRELPVSIQIIRQHNRYVWKFLQGTGSADTFIDAMQEALTYIEEARMKE